MNKNINGVEIYYYSLGDTCDIILPDFDGHSYTVEYLFASELSDPNTTRHTLLSYGSYSTTYTFPIDYAVHAPNSKYVSVVFYVTKYKSGSVVSTGSGTADYYIPDGIVPSCSVSVSEPTGYKSTYGAYLQRLSALSVSVTPRGVYGSTVRVCKITVDGQAHVSQTPTEPFEVSTDALQHAGAHAVTVYVEDSRGRAYTRTIDYTALAYDTPSVHKLGVKRCNAAGVGDAQGEYIQVTFSAAVTSLNSQNTATYAIEYKKQTGTTYTKKALTAYKNVFSVTDGSVLFAADTGSVYDVRLVVTDNFNETIRTTTASTALALLHWLASGLGLGIGKIAELDDVLDVGFRTRLMGGFLHPLLPDNTDLDEVLVPNRYRGKDAAQAKYLNCPVTGHPFTLDVLAAGEDGTVLTQVFTECAPGTFNMYARHYYATESGSYAWDEWDCVAGVAYILEKVYPVHSIYISLSPTDPALLFGGTWTQIKGRFLLAADGTASITYTKNGVQVTESLSAGSEGGEATHTLTSYEMPSHNHSLGSGVATDYVAQLTYNWGSEYGRYQTLIGVTGNNGGDQPHNNMPPYLAVYMWRRLPEED